MPSADAAAPLARAHARPRDTAAAGWWHFALLVAFSVPLFFTALGLDLLDPDEGLYADVSRTMYLSGDWVLPRFNGLPYLEKPPLFFWLAGLTLRGQQVEWPLRLWSALPALGTVLLTWRIGQRLYGRRAGLLAGVAMATMAGDALYVRKISTDFLFVFCMTLVMYGLTRDAVKGARGPGRFLWCYVGAGLGLMSKGLIGLAFPVLIIGATALWTRRLGWRDLNLARGAVVVAAIAGPWHLLVAWRDPALFQFYVVDNQILRFLGWRAFVEDDVPTSTAGFLVITFLWLFPWSVFLLSRRAVTRRAAPWRSFAVLWVVVVVGFFALSRSKLEYYALPAFPAVAVLAGGAWMSARDVSRWLVVGLVGCGVVGIAALWLGSRLTPEQTLSGLAEANVYYRILREQGRALPYESARPFALLLQALGGVLLVGWTAATVCWLREWRRASFACVTAVGVAIAVLIVALLHVVEPHHSAKSVAAAIVARLQPQDVIVHEGPLEYSAALPFYTGRRIVIVNGARGDLDIASRRPEARGYFLDSAGLAALWSGPRRVFIVTQRSATSGVVGTLPSVVALGDFGSRSLYSNKD